MSILKIRLRDTMKQSYFEMSIVPSSHKDIFGGFLLSFSDAIEERDAEGNRTEFILRSEENLDKVAFGVEELAKKLSKILKCDVSVKILITQKENQDWIKKYQDSVEPVQVGNIYVRPSWVAQKDGFVNIVIDPALAFGSGHHESTYGCLMMLQRYAYLGGRILDVGTGSGILAIAASGMGLIADICDTDEQALDSAKENFALNHVKYKNAWVGSAASAFKNNGGIKYSIIVANIVADVLLMIEKDLRDILFDDGILILSGILDKYADKIKSAYIALSLIDEFTVGEWRTLVYKR